MLKTTGGFHAAKLQSSAYQVVSSQDRRETTSTPRRRPGGWGQRRSSGKRQDGWANPIISLKTALKNAFEEARTTGDERDSYHEQACQVEI